MFSLLNAYYTVNIKGSILIFGHFEGLIYITSLLSICCKPLIRLIFRLLKDKDFYRGKITEAAFCLFKYFGILSVYILHFLVEMYSVEL